MSLVAEFSLPSDVFVLGGVLELDDVERIEFDCNIPARTSTMPYFWVWADDFEHVADVLGSETALESVSFIDELEGSRLYRAEWGSQVSRLLEATRESGAILRSVTGETNWNLELLFEERSNLEAFTSFYADTAIELVRLHSLGTPGNEHYGLTPAQQETLITAEQNGYYEVPRAITMEELAEELGVSLAAVSGRIRRGSSKLVRNTLL